MSETAIAEKLDGLTNAVIMLAAMTGARLTRAAMAERLDVHPNTLANRMATDRNFPRPGPDGKWLLCTVMEWEAGK